MSVDPLLALTLGALGLAVGSFLNVCIDRLPAGQSLVSPASHCPACDHTLGTLDLVPVFSYVGLKGRCRYCSSSIPVKLPVVEMALGVLFVLFYLKLGYGATLGMDLVYLSLFAVIFVIDLEHQLVLDKIVFPAMAVAFAFSFVSPNLDPIHSLEGGVLGFGVMAVLYTASRGGMGMGDVKLGALLGLIVGYPLTAVFLLLAVISGGVLSSLLLVSGLKKRRDQIPFAPFMVTSATVALLWGSQIWRWYQNLL